MTTRNCLAGIALLASALAGPPEARAHCDTLDGPVVKDARAALDSNDVTPVLKWVTAAKEAEIRQAFLSAAAVRRQGPEARTLADRFFFETLVRIHREAEGAPYTGLKPAGTPVDPAVAASDAALESGAVDPLVRLLVQRVEQGLRERFSRVAEAKRHSAESVELGRAYVAAYVAFTHYGERVLLSASAEAGHGEHDAASPHGDETHR